MVECNTHGQLRSVSFQCCVVFHCAQRSATCRELRLQCSRRSVQSLPLTSATRDALSESRSICALPVALGSAQQRLYPRVNCLRRDLQKPEICGFCASRERPNLFSLRRELYSRLGACFVSPRGLSVVVPGHPGGKTSIDAVRARLECGGFPRLDRCRWEYAVASNSPFRRVRCVYIDVRIFLCVCGCGDLYIRLAVGLQPGSAQELPFRRVRSLCID